MERVTHIDYVRPFLYEVSGIVGKRWNFRVLWELRSGKKTRYCELLESLSGISPSTLAEVLKQLQSKSLIRRIIHGKTPPLRVEYKITDNGMDLIVASSSLIKWAMRQNHKDN